MTECPRLPERAIGGVRLYTVFMRNDKKRIAILRPRHPEYPFVKPEGYPMLFDILVALIGTGGILLLAAYAALCERI